MGKYLIVAVAGCFVGWIFAHGVVATECARIGSFYVGKHDFACHLKPKATTQEPSA